MIELWAGLVIHGIWWEGPCFGHMGAGIDLAQFSPVITNGEFSAEHITDCLGDSWVHLFPEHTNSHQLTASTGTVIRPNPHHQIWYYTDPDVL